MTNTNSLTNTIIKAHAAINCENANTKGINYPKAKEAIKEAFKTDSVLLRLAAIDNFYSTNLGKNGEAIFDIAQTISEIKDIKKKFIEYYEGKKSDDIAKLFDKKFGAQNKRAISAISKYAYFLTDYKFPIYDSLVRAMLPKLVCGYKHKDTKTYFYTINKITTKLKVSVDQFDAFCWLYGKIAKAQAKNNDTRFMIGYINQYSDIFYGIEEYLPLSMSDFDI